MIFNNRGTLIFLFVFVFLQVKSQKPGDSINKGQISDSVMILGDVSVVAYRTSGKIHNLPGSFSLLNKEDLSPSDGTSLSATLNTIPGVTMQSGTYLTNRIVIRGMGSRTPYNTNRIRTYLNEIPLTSSDGVSTPEEIDLLSLEKIEIVKGPSSALYGSGLGGSINMYTPERSVNEGNIDLQYGSFNTLKAGASGTLNSGKARLWGSISHLNSDGYRENNDYRRTAFLSTARWMEKSWSVNATLLFIDVKGGIPSSLGKTLFEESPESAAPAWKAIEGFKEYSKGVASVSFNKKITRTLTGNLAVFGKYNDNYERRPFNNLDDQSLSGGFRGKFIHRTKKTELTAGAEWISEEYQWKFDRDNILLNKNSENLNHLNVFGILYYKPVKELNISLAGAVNHISYRLTDKFPSNGDQSGSRNFPTMISPRLGINYAPGDVFSIYASAGHGFSLPSPEETLLPEGDVNPGIKPEQGWQYETGVRFVHPGSRFTFDASLYRIDLTDLLVTKRVTEDVFTGINAGRTRHQGFELMFRSNVFEYNSFPGKLILGIGYSGSINRFIDFTDDSITYDGNILPGIPRQTVQLKINWTLFKTVEISTHLSYTGDQYITDSNSLEYPGYFLGDLKITTRFNLKQKIPLQVYLGINNVTDTNYASMLIVNAVGFGNSEPRYYYPGLPRHYFGGIRLSF
ncbi:MAG: TonB-dependent receptor [Bacteroidetes bacterium]|nr:TonB-dependent receptor [Bacteroidota bacterium]